MTDGCGANVYELLRLSSQQCLWLRIPQDFYTMMEGARLAQSPRRWGRSGTSASGTSCQLRIAVPHTEGSESGWWQGRTAAWIKCDSCEDYICTIHRTHAHDCDCPPIEEWKYNPYFARVIWPTPAARDWKGPSVNTPARDCLDFAVERGATKSKTYPAPPTTGGRLNPAFVEWLMGFPIGWTDCDALETPSCHRSQNSSDEPSCKPKE